jgi:hypothetical protein
VARVREQVARATVRDIQTYATPSTNPDTIRLDTEQKGGEATVTAAPASDQELISLADAAVDLDVAHTTLARQARLGRLPGARKIGPIWLVTRAGVEQYRSFSKGKPGRKTPGELC